MHVDPTIDAKQFKGEFQRGSRTDFCHIIPGMLALCDRNVLALACAPPQLLAGHGRRDKVSDVQAVEHYQRLFEKQYRMLGREDRFHYHIHEGGDTMPDQVVIKYFQRILADRRAKFSTR